MAAYRLFLIRDGEPFEEIILDCADDLDAFDAARTLCGDYDVEVYREIDLVARVKRGDAPLSVKDSRSL